MLSLLGSFIIVLLTLSFSFAGEDIVFKSRFDLESSEAVTEQLRILLKNNGFGDPYSQEISKTITIDLAQAMDEIPRDTQVWIRELQSILSVKLFESDYKLKIDHFHYLLQEFSTEFLPKTTRQHERLEYVTKSFVRGLQLGAEKISIEVALKRAKEEGPVIFSIDVIKPQFIVSPELVADISMHWYSILLDKGIDVTLDGADLTSIMEKVVKRPDLIELNAEDIRIPDVSIRIGRKKISFDQEKIKAFLQENKEDFKKGILDLLNVKLKDRFSNVLKDNPKTVIIPRKFSLEGDAPAVLSVENLFLVNNNILDFRLNGFFCKTKLDKDFCQTDHISVKERRKIGDDWFQKSLIEMNSLLTEQDNNIALSVSENFLNQLVEVTIRSGLWDKPLKDQDLELGPERAFVLAEKKGEISLYMDIVQRLSASQRIAVGAKELRFPVKFLIKLEILEVHDIPHLQIRVAKVETTPESVLSGYPQFELPTSVVTVPRFRKKVISEIMRRVGTFQDEVLLEVEIKELKGTYLDELQFFSDGMGRFTGVMGFK